MIKQSPKNLTILRLGGICGILSSFLIIVIVLYATWQSPWFNWQKNAISDLGVGEVSTLFNSTVVVGGFLNLIFSFGVQEYTNKNLKTNLGVSLLMVSSLCLTLVGIFTIESSLIHAVVALGFFLLAPIGQLLIGFGTQDQKIKKISLLIGSLALTAILILPIILIAMPIKVGFAVPEIIHAFILGIWTLYMTFNMFRFHN